MTEKMQHHGRQRDSLCIVLPALIHRIGRNGVNLLRVQARAVDCNLQRIRRSRNWQLTGRADQLEQLLIHYQQSATPAMPFVIKKIQQGLVNVSASQLEPPWSTSRLADVLWAHPTMTLAQLIAMTGCSLADARAARLWADDRELTE